MTQTKHLRLPGRSGSGKIPMFIRSSLPMQLMLISLGVTLTVAVGSAWILSHRIIVDTLNDVAREAARMATALSSEVVAQDFEPPTPARVDAWRQRIARVVGSLDIVGVKVWNANRQIVYSDDPTLIGRVYTLELEKDLIEVFEGKIAKELVRDQGELLLEVLVPITLGSNPRIVGVYESYRRYALLQAEIHGIKRTVWGVSVAAFGLLYASLYFLTRTVNRRLSTLASFPMLDPNPVIETDLDASVTYTNPAAEQLFPDLQVLGRSHPILSAVASISIELARSGPRSKAVEVKFGGAIYLLEVNYLLEMGVVRAYGFDITERRRAEEDRLAKNAAEASSQAKSEFLSRMSHELRTPLNAILGFGQLLEMDSASGEQRESVDQILKAGRHLLNLINEVLDIARIEEGRLTLSIEPVAVHDVVTEVLDLIRPSATDRRLVLTAHIPDELVILADRQRFKQVILNLLSNAVKFNFEGGSVTLSCERRPQERLRISISDTGPGISAADLPKLYTPFERLSAGQTGVEGIGLGLMLSKRLMEAMHGGIGAESTIGKGSTFWLELPLAVEPALESQGREPEAFSGRGTPANIPVRTVLYIEDNLSNLKLLERVMARRPDVRLLTAMQGRLGLDLARQHRPDLILLDLDLPDVRGDQVLRTLRDDVATGDIPVVMLTATATPGEIDRLLNSGARAYLTKPFDVKTLFRLLDEVVAA